jgi:hypothetical protein
VNSRLVTTVDIDEVDFKGWSGLHWALVREVLAVIALRSGLYDGFALDLDTGCGRDHAAGGKLPGSGGSLTGWRPYRPGVDGAHW